MKFEMSSMIGNVLKVYKDKLIIGQKGILGLITRGLSGEKTIYFRDITSIQFKETGLTSGYLEFSFPGSHDSHGLTDIGENKFLFAACVGLGKGKALNQKATIIKSYIEDMVNMIKSHVSSPSSSIADELLKFKTLLDSGLISQEEFGKKKFELLN